MALQFLPRKCVINATGEVRRLVPHDEQGLQRRWVDVDNGDTFPNGEVTQVPIEPYAEFGVECGDGWLDLLTPLFECINHHNEGLGENDPTRIEVLQVKEKFGALRFYTNQAPDDLQKLIDEAEAASCRTCEVCGSTTGVKTVSRHGWLMTRCEKCLRPPGDTAAPTIAE